MAPTVTPLQGHYINLKSNTSRRQSCEEQISERLLSQYYSRFEAIDGTEVAAGYSQFDFPPGKLGCWLSHLAVMEKMVNMEGHHHILEDDFTLTSAFSGFHSRFSDHTSHLGEWDIIFTDVDIAGMRDVSAMRALINTVSANEAKGRFILSPAENLYTAGNTSYIVNQSSKSKVYKLMKKGLTSGLPNDLYLRKLIRDKRIIAFVMLPFLTSVSDEFMESTIWGQISDVNPSIMFATLFRRSLAWGANSEKLLDTFRHTIAQQRPIGPRRMIYAQLVAHFLSDDYKPY